MADQTEKALDNLGVAVDTMKERITRLEEQMKTIYNSVDRVEKKLDKLIEQAGDHDVDVAIKSV